MSEAEIGRRVSVEGFACSGVLRFFGQDHITGRARCGVELDEPLGHHSGTVDGHRYFDCEEQCGVLCSPSAVTVLDQ